MPRITDSSGFTHDFCKRCLPNEADAENIYGMAARGEGPYGSGDLYDYCKSDQPGYGSHPGQFECDHCGRELTRVDDARPTHLRLA